MRYDQERTKPLDFWRYYDTSLRDLPGPNRTFNPLVRLPRREMIQRMLDSAFTEPQDSERPLRTAYEMRHKGEINGEIITIISTDFVRKEEESLRRLITVK